MLAEERNYLFEAFCGDDALSSLQSPSSFFDALIRPFLDCSWIEFYLLIIDALLFIIIDIVLNANSLDLDLLDFQLEISFQGGPGFHVIIDAGTFCDFFWEGISWTIGEVSVFLFIGWGSVHVALELIVIWWGSLFQVVWGVAALLVLLGFFPFFRLGRDIQISCGFVLQSKRSELNVQFSLLFLKFLNFLLDFRNFIIELFAALEDIIILIGAKSGALEGVDLASRSGAFEVCVVFVEIGGGADQLFLSLEGPGDWVILAVCLYSVYRIIPISVFIVKRGLRGDVLELGLIIHKWRFRQFFWLFDILSWWFRLVDIIFLYDIRALMEMSFIGFLWLRNLSDSVAEKCGLLIGSGLLPIIHWAIGRFFEILGGIFLIFRQAWQNLFDFRIDLIDILDSWV